MVTCFRETQVAAESQDKIIFFSFKEVFCAARILKHGNAFFLQHYR